MKDDGAANIWTPPLCSRNRLERVLFSPRGQGTESNWLLTLGSSLEPSRSDRWAKLFPAGDLAGNCDSSKPRWKDLSGEIIDLSDLSPKPYIILIVPGDAWPLTHLTVGWISATRQLKHDFQIAGRRDIPQQDKWDNGKRARNCESRVNSVNSTRL